MTAIFPTGLVDAARALLAALQSRGLRLVTAESCTGGLLCGLLTEIAGASRVLERGLVTYSNDAKVSLLNVDRALIEQAGAVSEDVARAMAEGALAQAPAEMAIAVTGIAGPDGGTATKPVGLVYIAVAVANRETRVRECRFGDIGRTGVRLASLAEAITLAQTALGAADGD